MRIIKFLITLGLVCFLSLIYVPKAWAFCGFYVAKADTKLYNKASQVVIARDGDRTILTMANDFQGSVKDFAIVVPVPVTIKKEQVNISDNKIIERLDAFSSPRLVEYFDSNPCYRYRGVMEEMKGNAPAPSAAKMSKDERSLGVTIEAKFTVGEYDILVLSAKDSNGLETWLNLNKYKIPSGASQILQPYIKQKMKFFVSKVNLKEFQKSGTKYLRPIQIAYQSPKFILPIRLGMINSLGEQDLLVYVLSPKGQAELTNYRQVNVPTDAEIPEFVKDKFGDFYKAMFQKAYSEQGKKVGFVEYAWNMANCDPCSAEPLNREELQKAGVFWLNESDSNVFITRFHVRYTRNKFPEDLMFQETSNQQSFQGRYIMRHPYKGEANCEAAQQYKQQLKQRFKQEAQTLARLTGWNIRDIYNNMSIVDQNNEPFWRNIWK